MRIRTLSGMLALLLAVSGSIGAIAELQPTPNAAAIDLTQIQPYESALSLCWVRDTLYILGVYGIYQWQSGNDQLSVYADMAAAAQYQYMQQKPEDPEAAKDWAHAIKHLFTDGQALYGLHPYSGEIFQITEAGFQSLEMLPSELLYAGAGDEAFLREIKGVSYMEDKLFILLGTDDYNEYNKTELFSFDLVTQSLQKCFPVNVYAIASAEPGKLALFITNESSAIWQYDIATDSVEQQLYTMQEGEAPSGMAWFSGKNALAHYTASRVALTSISGESQTKAYIPISFSSVDTKAACSADGLYAYPYSSHVFLRDLSIEGEVRQTVLRVLGDVPPSLLVAFSFDNPDIAVVPFAASADEYLQQAVITADTSVDIFVVSATDSYSDMKKKAFAAPLDADAELVAMARELYPAIQEVIFDGDHLVAYPLIFQPNSWTVNETVWKALGLPEYPTTYEELFGLIALWLDDYAEDYSEYTLSDVQQGSIEALVTVLVREYIFQSEDSDKRLTFDTPAFRLLMQSVIDNAYLLSEEHGQWGMPLINTYYQGFGSSYNDDQLVRMLLPLTINKDAAQMLGADMELLVMNAASTQQDAATKFIAFCAEQMDTTTRYSINPGLNEPVRNANYEARLETLNQELEALQGKLASADELQQKTLQEEIDQKLLTIESAKTREWSISAENIEAYRSVVEHLRIPYNSAFLGESMTGGFAAISEIIAQYCSDGLTADELPAFIRALDQVTYMVYMEGR